MIVRSRRGRLLCGFLCVAVAALCYQGADLLADVWLSASTINNEPPPASHQRKSSVLPSVREGLTTTQNELADEVVELSANADALSHLSKKAGAPVSKQSCDVAMAAFRSAHDEVMRRHSEYLLKETPPDRWVNPAPVCGIYALYNHTGEFYLASAAPAGPIVAGQPFSMLLQNCQRKLQLEEPSGKRSHLRGSQEPFSACTDLYVAARLIGPTIVAAQVTRSGEAECDIVVSFVVHDPGEYHLDVQVVWLDGLGPERSPPQHPTVLRKIHSKFGRKPHQKYVLNDVCEAQTHVVGSPFPVVVAPLVADARHVQPLPVCTFQHHHGYGRWVQHDNDIPCNASTPFCSGDPSLLNDAKPFNDDVLWAPFDCRLHYYKYQTGPSGPCTKRRGTMLLMGDSTTREYAQSLRMFDLRATNLAVDYANWKLDWQYFSRHMAEKSVARLGKELEGSKPVVLVANLGPLHLIGGLKTDDWEFYVQQWEKLFRGGSLSFIEKKIFLGPAAIHYATNDMTAQRMLNWMRYAYEKLSPLGFEYVAAWNMTEARAEASWDGVHYSAERGKAQMKHLRRRRKVFKWNGGVSVMLTNLLLNMLCPGTAV